MTYGFPGSTSTVRIFHGHQQKIEIDRSALSKLIDLQRDYLLEEMKKDPSIKLQLSASYADLSNEWKFYDGELKALVKINVIPAEIKAGKKHFNMGHRQTGIRKSVQRLEQALCFLAPLFQTPVIHLCRYDGITVDGFCRKSAGIRKCARKTKRRKSNHNPCKLQ